MGNYSILRYLHTYYSIQVKRIRNWEKDDSFYFHQTLDKKQTNLIIETIDIENDYKGDLLESNLLARSDKSYSEDAFYHILKTKSNNSDLSFISGYKQTAEKLFKIIQDILIVNNVDGIFIETHTDPSQAKSDGANMLDINNLEELLNNLLTLRAAASKI